MLSVQSSSPFFQTPSTPGRSSYYSARSHQPFNSSPLASPKSSPVVAAQARRQAQYKTRVTSSSRTPISISKPVFAQTSNKTPDDPDKSLLRESFRARCLERAKKERQEKVTKRRTPSSSDVFFDCEMDCDEDEDEESVMQDEVRGFPVRGFLLRYWILSCSSFGESLQMLRTRKHMLIAFHILMMSDHLSTQIWRT
jgi:hypothetical protein